MYSPKYTITNKILKNVGRIEASRAIIENAVLVPAWHRSFQQEALLRTIHYSTRLEGNKLSLKNTSQVIDGEKIEGGQRDIQEILNYREALGFINKARRIPQKFVSYKESELKELHKVMMKKILPEEETGAYRETQVVIKTNEIGKITFTPPPAIEVPIQMETFFAWLNSLRTREIHPILKAGISLYELGRIHPFLDGNGRTARSFVTLILYKEGYDIKRFFCLEEYYDKDAISFYKALQSVDKKAGELTPWLEYFTKGLAEELEKVVERVKKLSLDISLKDKFDKRINISPRQTKILEHLKKHNYILMKQAKELLPMISEDTILREMRDLMKKRIIKRVGRTKGAMYALKR